MNHSQLVKLKALIALLLAGCLLLAGASSVQAEDSPGTTTRVSVDSSGSQANDESWNPSISADGRFVVFRSEATNLVPGGTNGTYHIFVHDRQTGQTELASVATGGAQGNGRSDHPVISADGRFVAFESQATNLVPGDTNDDVDVFVRDRQTGQTERVSVGAGGTQSSGGASQQAAISVDGRFVAFRSFANNLVPGDTNNAWDVFVRDRQTGQTERVSVSSSGVQGNALSDSPSLSADGRIVAFSSDASNLVASDTNNQTDIFVRDRQTSQTTRVSVSSSGAQADGWSQEPFVSLDGRHVAFASFSSNLVPGDNNSQIDIFVRDRQLNQTERVSVNSSGGEANSWSEVPSLSADGRYAAFASFASNMVVGDTNGNLDVFVRDRQTNITWRISLVTGGAPGGNSGSGHPSISADGRHIAFESWADNLVPNDTNNEHDIFVHDRGESRLFADVPTPGKEWMAPWIESFYNAGITTGCAANPLQYCPEREVTRAEMAVFVLRALNYPHLPYNPPDQSGTFADMPVAGKEWMEPWVEQFYDLGITTGCAANPLAYCPERQVTRAEMAVFILRAKYGGGYQPPPGSGTFADVPVAGKEWMQPWIEQFYREGITTGCAASPLQYCPERPVTRAETAVFILRAFDALPSP